jgi:hypothetical protein
MGAVNLVVKYGFGRGGVFNVNEHVSLVATDVTGNSMSGYTKQ